MVSPSQKRLGCQIITEKGFSQRRACRVLNLSRKTARYKPKESALNQELTE